MLNFNFGQFVSSLNLRHVVFTILISQLAWPATFMFNLTFQKLEGQQGLALLMMVCGFFLLSMIVLLVSKISSLKDWMYYGAALFSFTAIIDLIIALEVQEIISGFMTVYLKYGEPYLYSSWGFAIGLFDPLAFYFMYLTIIFCLDNRKCIRGIGIYWAAGLLNSMITEIYALLVGKMTPTFCSLLNIPYFVFPIAAIIRICPTKTESIWDDENMFSSHLSIKHTGLFRYILAVGFLLSIWINLAFGFCSLSSDLTVFKYMLTSTPVINLEDPLPYTRFQALVYLFYIVPIQLVCLIFLFKKSEPKFLWDAALIHAGIMIQGQFSLMAVALHPKTPSAFQSSWKDPIFWISNLTIFIVPHFYLIYLSRHWKSDTRLLL